MGSLQHSLAKKEIILETSNQAQMNALLDLYNAVVNDLNPYSSFEINEYCSCIENVFNISPESQAYTYLPSLLFSMAAKKLAPHSDCVKISSFVSALFEKELDDLRENDLVKNDPDFNFG